MPKNKRQKGKRQANRIQLSIIFSSSPPFTSHHRDHHDDDRHKLHSHHKSNHIVQFFLFNIIQLLSSHVMRLYVKSFIFLLTFHLIFSQSFILIHPSSIHHMRSLALIYNKNFHINKVSIKHKLTRYIFSLTLPLMLPRWNGSFTKIHTVSLQYFWFILLFYHVS